MKNLKFIILLLCYTNIVFGQTVKEVNLSVSNTENYFVVEPKGEIKGVMVLLPGGGENAEDIFAETMLHNVAYLHNILVVAMAYGHNTVYITDDVRHKMDTVLEDVKNRYNIPRNKFVIGGFSAGGITSLCYTIYANKYPLKTAVSPQAVFTADAPVDLIEIWNTLNREIERKYSDMAVDEAQRFLPVIERDMGGTPNDNLENYIEHSPYTHIAKDGGNIKYLLNTPVRLHHDPDIVWQLKNRRRSYFDMNELYASAMVNWLLLNGNDRAEFVTADRPAVRSSGTRHPHSWSVIEEVSCVLWIKNCLGIG